jgi:hypothetical protein
VFGKAPDLFTAAHEVFHSLEQQTSQGKSGGVGQANDTYEQRADAAAELVVAGKSAAHLLPAAAGIAALTPAVQMRRVPANVAGLLSDAKDASKTSEDFAAHREGLITVLKRAVVELTPEEIVILNQSFGQPVQSLLDTGTMNKQQLIQLSIQVIGFARNGARPNLTLGNPSLRRSPLRDGTSDAKHLKVLLRNANRVFDAVVGGQQDQSLIDVFSAPYAQQAKAAYEKAQLQMNEMAANNLILCDRSGIDEETGRRGETMYAKFIMLAADVLDNPDANSSIITLMHESMHAGNEGLGDEGGYKDSPGFISAAANVKIKNAAHYEVALRRHLGEPYSFKGSVFIPAQPSATPAVTPAAPATRTEPAEVETGFQFEKTVLAGLPPIEDAPSAATTETSAFKTIDSSIIQPVLTQASAVLRRALVSATELHYRQIELFENPTLWNSQRAKIIERSLLQGLTVHKRVAHIDPSSTDPSTAPLTAIDLALSEGFAHRVYIAYSASPNDYAQMLDIERTFSADIKMAGLNGNRSDLATMFSYLVLGLLSAPTRTLSGNPLQDLQAISKLPLVQ